MSPKNIGTYDYMIETFFAREVMAFFVLPPTPFSHHFSLFILNSSSMSKK